MSNVALNSTIGVGLHLNLTEGQPVSPPDTVPSLLGGDGRSMKGKMGIRSDPPNASDVRRETDAQIELFVSRYGCVPAHLDGHQHVHVLDGLCATIAEAMQQYRIPLTRIPRQNVTESWVPSVSRSFFQSVCSDATNATPVYRNAGIRFSDAFIGLSTQGCMASEERILEALGKIPESITDVEWMVHPGIACVHGHGDEFNASADRDHERALLSLPRLKQQIESLGFTFAND